MENDHHVSPATIQKHLGGLNYPADKHTLVRHAQSRNAPQDVVSMLNKLPDKEYQSPVDVEKEVGNME